MVAFMRLPSGVALASPGHCLLETRIPGQSALLSGGAFCCLAYRVLPAVTRGDAACKPEGNQGDADRRALPAHRE